LHNLLPNAVRFDIANVAQYYFVEADQEYWRLSRHLPNLAPPYPVMWIAYPIPDVIHSEDYGMVDNSGNASRQGVLISATDLESGNTPLLRNDMFPPVMRWVFTIAVFAQMPRVFDQAIDDFLPMTIINVLIQSIRTQVV
jgi:hypothetical protein